MGYGVAMTPHCYTHLSDTDREPLSLGLAQGQSLRTRVLGRAPSTLSRESARNTTRGRPYRACTAQTLAATRARQPRRQRKLLDPWLWESVQTQLRQGCSPEQIAGRLRHAYPDDMRKHRSTETLYAGLYVLPRGALRSERLAALRQARRPRAQGTDRRGQIPNITSIVERPAEVATRTVPGHWEGDLIKGARNGSAVGTLVERTTRLVILPGWRGPMPRVPERASARNSGLCPHCCGKP
jgi:transposase, IS30 family